MQNKIINKCMDRREFQRLYNALSAARREARIQALMAAQPPEVPNLAQRSREVAEATSIWGDSYAQHGLEMEQDELRERWRHGLDERRRREIDSLPDPETAHAGMLGSLRAALFSEVTRDDIPIALSAHDDIVRLITNGHGWLIPTFQLSLDQYVNAEYREYQLTCTMLGQPIVRDVRRIMEHLFEQLLINRILEVIRDGRIRTRDGRISVRDLQYALTTPTMEGLIDFIVVRDGGLRRDAGGYGELNTTMEALANPENLARLGTVVATHYRGNIEGRGEYLQQVRGRFEATARYFDGLIATAGGVELEGGGGSVMPIAQYRQLQGVFEALTDDDLFQQRARRIDPRAAAAASAAEARRDAERDVYREFERRLDDIRARQSRRPPTASRRPLDDIDALFSNDTPVIAEEFEQLPKSKFYPKLSDPACRVCYETVHEETGEEITIACRHPQLPGGLDVCGGAYHVGCITTLKEKLRANFHCLRCFAGRNAVATRNAEGVVVGQHIPPFHLFYQLRNPSSPAEARENEEYEASLHAQGAAMLQERDVAPAMAPTREELRQQAYEAAQRRQEAAQAAAQRDETRGREREDDDENSGKKSKRRGGKKYKRTKKYR